MAATAIAPNSTKMRGTKVRVDWFYDQARKQWRFLPADLTHRAEYERTDAEGGPLQPARPAENKGWTPADLAIQNIAHARRTAPKAVQDRFPSLFAETKESN